MTGTSSCGGCSSWSWRAMAALKAGAMHPEACWSSSGRRHTRPRYGAVVAARVKFWWSSGHAVYLPVYLTELHCLVKEVFGLCSGN